MEVGLRIQEYLGVKGISQAHISRETRIGPVKLNLDTTFTTNSLAVKIRSEAALDTPTKGI